MDNAGKAAASASFEFDLVVASTYNKDGWIRYSDASIHVKFYLDNGTAKYSLSNFYEGSGSSHYYKESNQTDFFIGSELDGSDSNNATATIKNLKKS